VIERVPIVAILPLRQAVLRPALPPEASSYAEDDAPTTIHLAAYEGSDVIGCVTVFPEALADEPAAWRLRGMATDPVVRGTGVGARLLAAAIEAATATGAPLLWCNARAPAEGFYARYGFIATGELFDVPSLGPHRFMRLRLDPGRVSS
jgi:predicted GNAT family N-acyltransferase